MKDNDDCVSNQFYVIVKCFSLHVYRTFNFKHSADAVIFAITLYFFFVYHGFYFFTLFLKFFYNYVACALIIIIIMRSYETIVQYISIYYNIIVHA